MLGGQCGWLFSSLISHSDQLTNKLPLRLFGKLNLDELVSDIYNIEKSLTTLGEIQDNKILMGLPQKDRNYSLVSIHF
jgi:hypothetical protein